MKHLLIAGIVLATLLAATGCSGGSDASPGLASYLAESGSKVAFIQWRSAPGGHLHGTITEGSVGGSGSAQRLSVSSAPFTGTMSHNSVELTFAVPYFLRAHAHGRINGSVLTIALPQSDGTVRHANLSQSDKAGFDHAISTLRTKIRHASVVAANQQASRSRQSPHAQAVQSTQSSLNTLDEQSSIAHGGRLADDVARLAALIQVAQSHLVKEKRDASGDNRYCSASFTVTGDSEAVGGALAHAEGAVLGLTADVTAVRLVVATTSADLRHLRRSGLAAPSRAPNVIARANSSLKQAIVTANSYINQLNAIEVRARTLADNMAVRRCSGARSGAVPHPIPHIPPGGGNQH